MKFVYHLGVHKTGSTLLQHNLAANAAALRDQKIYCLNTEWAEGLNRVRQRLRRIENVNRDTPPLDVLANINRRIQRFARNDGAETVLVSEENFLGTPIHRLLSWGMHPASFYPSAARCLQSLTWGIDPASIRIVIYTRKQDAILRGHYSEALRVLRCTDSFAEFLDRTDIGSFRFDDLLARLRTVLPGAEFVTRPFEPIRAGADPFVRGFADACGIDAAALKPVAGVVNPGLDRDQAAELRDLCKRMNAGETRAPIRNRAVRINRTPGDPGKPIEIPPAYRSRIDALMQDDLPMRLLAQLAPASA